MPKLRQYLAAVAVLAAIIYLSLYPFHWRANLPATGPLVAFLSSWRSWPQSRGDFIANTIFYLPLGYALFSCLSARLVPIVRLLITTIVAILVSIGMELSQFYIAERVDDIRDSYANALGGLLGALAAMGLGADRKPTLVAIFKRDLFISLLLAAFVAARLYPYVPVIDLHKYWHAIRPLLSSPIPGIDEIFLRTIVWTAVYYILQTLFSGKKAIAAFLAVTVLVFGGQILVADIELRVGELLGAALALVIGIPLIRLRALSAPLLGLLFAAAVTIERLQPFNFGLTTRGLTWVPFASIVGGSPERGMLSMLEKSFLYGTFIWLLTEAGLPRWCATVGVALLLLLCGFAEPYLPGRSAEITDTVLALMLGGGMSLLAHPRPEVRSAANPKSPSRSPRN